MYDPDINDDTTLLYGNAPIVPSGPQTPDPQETTLPAKRKSSRTVVVLGLTLLLGIVFSTGLVTGCTLNGNTNNQNQQTNTLPSVTVPALTGSNLQDVREAVIAKVRPSVVQVNVSIRGGSGIGSGVIVDPRGYIVTNNHVVNGAQSIQVVLYDGKKLDAQLVGTASTDDLAVVKITPPETLVTAVLGDSSKLQVGQDVLAIGNPLGITQTVTSGIISALDRTVSEGNNGATIPGAIQTDAAINPGNSGGALVDMQGTLIGIPTLTAIDPEFNTPANGVGFAIPVNRIKQIVPQLIQNGQVNHTGRAALGVKVTTVDQVLAAQNNLSVDHGAYIVTVIANGAAANAGLRVGDVIVGIDNTEITDTASLGAILSAKNPGDTVAVRIYRGNQQLTVNVKLGELQAG